MYVLKEHTTWNPASVGMEYKKKICNSYFITAIYNTNVTKSIAS